MKDLKYALRQLLKSPGFTIVAVVTLALGVGATTSIFSVVNTVLLRPLPYPEPDRLVRVYSEFPGFPNGGLRRFAVSIPEYLDLRRETKSWETLEGWISTGVNLAADTQPVRVTASFVTGGLLRTLGATPILGRSLSPEDDVPGAPPVAAISHGLWQRAFAGDPGVLGRDILFNGNKCTVAAVMPTHFQFPPGELNPTEIWTPLRIDPANPGGRSEHGFNLLGRLQPGVTLAQAQAEMQALSLHWGATGSDHRFDATNHTIVSYGFHDEVVRGVRPALRMLLGAVASLLLIACVNVANLLLARAEARQREIAIRGALGAGLRRLMLQFVIEGVVLSAIGVAAGLLLAQVGLEFIKATLVASIPRAGDIGIDMQVMCFAAAVTLGTGVMFGLTPLAHVLKRDLHNSLKSAASSTTGGANIQHFRQALVVGQLALALVLLIGTGLMLRAFWKLQEVNAGIEPKNVMTMGVALPGANYEPRQARDFWARLEARLGALPGVESAGFISGLPPVYGSTHSDTVIEGFVPTPGGPVQNVEFYQSVSQGSFNTLRLRFVEGRAFDDRDGPDAPEVAIINQTMARTFWGNNSPVGRRIRPSGTTNWCTIVGVVADAKNGGLEKPAGTEVYLPYTQSAGRRGLWRQNIVIRAPGNPAAMVSAVRREVAALDPALPVTNIRAMNDVLAAARSRPHFLTLLLTAFAGVALVLAAVGIYGVISYSVARRAKEIGLRMALGAQRGNVLGLVLGGGLRLTLAGLLFGLAGAFALTRFLSTLLFGITPTDPVTFAVVSLLLALVAVVATYIPARRASKVDPMVALRNE